MKTTKKIVKKTPVRKHNISKVMDTESLLARLIDMGSQADRIVLVTDFIIGAPKEFQRSVLRRMTRNSAIAAMEYAQKGIVPVEAPGLIGGSVIAPVDSKIVPPPPVPAAPANDHNTVTAVVGPYSSQWAADQDVQQYLHPKVMTYRNTVFPSPSTFGVTAMVLSATAIKIADRKDIKPRHPTLAAAYPFGIEIVVNVQGDNTKVQNWKKAFDRLNHFTKVS